MINYLNKVGVFFWLPALIVHVGDGDLIIVSDRYRLVGYRKQSSD
jgi:hypothetical protein